jgi:hypothetical protein
MERQIGHSKGVHVIPAKPTRSQSGPAQSDGARAPAERGSGRPICSITTKKGAATFEGHYKLAALETCPHPWRLLRAAGPSSGGDVNQVNIGSDTALAVRRFAFAIAKAQHTQSLLPQPAL